jgi:hypothetical protein
MEKTIKTTSLEFNPAINQLRKSEAVVPSVSLLNILQFIANSSKRIHLKAIKIALQCRVKYFEYEITYKNGHRDILQLDSPDTLIRMLVEDRFVNDVRTISLSRNRTPSGTLHELTSTRPKTK